MRETFVKALLRGAGEIGINVSEAQADLMVRHAQDILEGNEKAGLTDITEPEAMAIKHYVDSLTCLHLMKASDSLVDVGTGAGLPGIPLKIMIPTIDLTLVEATMKKARFLEGTLRHLGLEGRVINMRTEDYSRGAGRESHDVAVARAVAKMSVLSEYCLGLVKVGGLFIAMKGPAPELETSRAAHSIRVMGGRVESVEEMELPLGFGSRSLVLVRKVAPSPRAYPRKAGTVARKPL